MNYPLMVSQPDTAGGSDQREQNLTLRLPLPMLPTLVIVALVSVLLAHLLVPKLTGPTPRRIVTHTVTRTTWTQTSRSTLYVPS